MRKTDKIPAFGDQMMPIFRTADEMTMSYAARTNPRAYLFGIVLTLISFSILSCAKAPEKSGAGSSSQSASSVHSENSSSATMNKENPMTIDHKKISFATITGESTTLESFGNRVILIVNTASECGFTTQYEGLEDIYEKYKDRGLTVIGFPADNYGGQEPGSNEEISQFCKKNYGVTFPMMSKISVNGDDKHPLFAYLTESSPIPGKIKWNFGKFLLDRNGTLVARFGSDTEPNSPEVISAIEKLL
jgi:glutathione peroxidase